MNISQYFTTNNDRKVSTLTDEAPQWLQDAIYEAHYGMPSDVIYSMFHRVAESLDEYDSNRFADEDEAEQIANEIADSLCEFRTYGLLQWSATPEGAAAVNVYLSDFGGTTVRDTGDWTLVLMSANAHAYYTIVLRLIHTIVALQKA